MQNWCIGMFRIVGFYLKHTSILLAVMVLGYWAWLDKTVGDRFQAQQWDLPARVYAAPIELFEGATVSLDQFISNLSLLGYKKTTDPVSSGQYSVNGAATHCSNSRISIS